MLTPGANLADTLQRAEGFVSGFSDDLGQEGIADLLHDLRAHSVRAGALVPVWHLVGPQGCGKTTYASHLAQILAALCGYSAVCIDAFDFRREFEGRPDRLTDTYGRVGLLMVEHMVDLHDSAALPFAMKGDRVLKFIPGRRYPEDRTAALLQGDALVRAGGATC